MGKYLISIGLLVVVVVPFLMRREAEVVRNPDARVVIVTPHLEAIRHEFGQGFRTWYRERTGQEVLVDWRVIGGTSDIVRKLTGDYEAAFQNYWENVLKRDWSTAVKEAYANPRIALDATPEDDTPEEAARRAFLESEVSSGVDIFFGGGSFDFSRQADAGTLVADGLLERRPDWFDEDSLPQTYAGEPYWDAEGRWYGAVLSTFGIVFNRDSLARLGIEEMPDAWADLADPRLAGEIALADPTKSGSVTKAFEMIVQTEMQRIETALLAEGLDHKAAEARAVEEGWLAGMRLIQIISANARYFSDSSTQPPTDVSQGNCAAGMAIDFYGRLQEEAVEGRGGDDRFGFVTPQGASTVSVDPIGLLRGAPNREVAEAFIEFTMSLEGQKLWNFRPGTPGGPSLYALRRAPARKELYAPEFAGYRSDPEVNDYEGVGAFVYRGRWTGPLFNALRFIIRVAYQDPHPELQDAWEAIIAARAEGREYSADAAMAVLQDLSAIDIARAKGEITQVIRTRDKIEEVRLSKELYLRFRSQYERAGRIARGEEGI